MLVELILFKRFRFLGVVPLSLPLLLIPVGHFMYAAGRWHGESPNWLGLVVFVCSGWIMLWKQYLNLGDGITSHDHFPIWTDLFQTNVYMYIIHDSTNSCMIFHGHVSRDNGSRLYSNWPIVEIPCVLAKPSEPPTVASSTGQHYSYHGTNPSSATWRQYGPEICVPCERNHFFLKAGLKFVVLQMFLFSPKTSLESHDWRWFRLFQEYRFMFCLLLHYFFRGVFYIWAAAFIWKRKE